MWDEFVHKAKPTPCGPGHLSHLPDCSGAPGTLRCQPEQLFPPRPKSSQTSGLAAANETPQKASEKLRLDTPKLACQEKPICLQVTVQGKSGLGFILLQKDGLDLLVNRLITVLKFSFKNIRREK